MVDGVQEPLSYNPFEYLKTQRNRDEKELESSVLRSGENRGDPTKTLNLENSNNDVIDRLKYVLFKNSQTPQTSDQAVETKRIQRPKSNSSKDSEPSADLFVRQNPELESLVSERLFQATGNYRSSLENISNERDPNAQFSPREIQIQEFLAPESSTKESSAYHQVARELLDLAPSKIAPASKALSILFAGVEKDKQSQLASDLTKAINIPEQSDVEKLFGLMNTADTYLTGDKKQETLDRIASELLASSSGSNNSGALKHINDLLGDSSNTEGAKLAVVKALTDKISGGDPKKLEELRALLPGLVNTSTGQLRDLRTVSNQVTKSILGSVANFSQLTADQKEVLKQISPEIDLTDPQKSRTYVTHKAYRKTHEGLEQAKSNGLLGGWLSPSAWGASYNQKQIESDVLNYSGVHGDQQLVNIDVDKLRTTPAEFTGVPSKEQLHQAIREGFAQELHSQVTEQTRTKIEEQKQELIELAKIFERLPGNKPESKVDIYSLASLESVSREFKPSANPPPEEVTVDSKNKEEIKSAVLGSVITGLQYIDTQDVDKIAQYLSDPQSQNPMMALESALMKTESASSKPEELSILASLISTIPKDQISNFTPALHDFMNKASTLSDSQEKQKAFMSLLNTRVQGLEPDKQAEIFSKIFTTALSRSPDDGQIKLFSDLLSRVDDSKKENVLQSIASLPLGDTDRMKSLLEDPNKLRYHLSEQNLQELKSNLVDAGIKLLDEKAIRDGNPIDPILQGVLGSTLKDFDLSQLPKLLSSDPANKQAQKQFLDDLVTKAFQAKKEAVKELMVTDQQIEFSNFLADLKSLESMTKVGDVQAEAGNKPPDSIPAYLLANAKPDQIQALSQALLDMKDIQTLQKASNEQITQLFDSVLTGLHEPSQADLISGLLTQSSPQQDQSQAQSVAKALVAMRSKPEVFAGALRDLSQVESSNAQNRDLEAFKIISKGLQDVRLSNISDQELRNKHKEILSELIKPKVEESLGDFGIQQSDKEIYRDLAASALLDFNPDKLDNLINQINNLSTQSSQDILISGKQLLQSLLQGQFEREDTKISNADILNPLATDLITGILQTSHAKKYGLDKASQEARQEAASYFVDFATSYDPNDFSTQNLSQILNLSNALLDGLKPEDQKSFLQQASLDILTKAGMPADKEHYSKLVGDFITGMSNDQRKSIIDVGLAFYAHPELSPNQIFSNSEQLSSQLGLPKDLVESAQKGLADSGLKILQNQAKSKNLPIDFSTLGHLLSPGSRGSLVDHQGRISSQAIANVAQQVGSNILDDPKTQEERAYRQQAYSQKEFQHQNTVRNQARSRGLPGRAASEWYPGARAGLFQFARAIAYPKMNRGYYGSRHIAESKMRQEVVDTVAKELSSNILSDSQKKQSLELFSQFLQSTTEGSKAAGSLDTRISDLENLKNLSGLVDQLNPQKEFLTALTQRFQKNDSPSAPQLNAVKIKNSQELSTYYADVKFTDKDRQNLLRDNDYFVISGRDGKSYLAYRSKSNPNLRRMWEFAYRPDGRLYIPTTESSSIPNEYLTFLDSSS